jgi:hypothetical protein
MEFSNLNKGWQVEMQPLFKSSKQKERREYVSKNQCHKTHSNS